MSLHSFHSILGPSTGAAREYAAKIVARAAIEYDIVIPCIDFWSWSAAHCARSQQVDIHPLSKAWRRPTMSAGFVTERLLWSWSEPQPLKQRRIHPNQARRRACPSHSWTQPSSVSAVLTWRWSFARVSLEKGSLRVYSAVLHEKIRLDAQRKLGGFRTSIFVWSTAIHVIEADISPLRGRCSSWSLSKSSVMEGEDVSMSSHGRWPWCPNDPSPSIAYTLPIVMRTRPYARHPLSASHVKQ